MHGLSWRGPQGVNQTSSTIPECTISVAMKIWQEVIGLKAPPRIATFFRRSSLQEMALDLSMCSSGHYQQIPNWDSSHTLGLPCDPLCFLPCNWQLVAKAGDVPFGRTRLIKVL
eukprot:SAG31_NODE_33486_length_343_cov_0.844262_1_plen_113_part_11